MNLSRSWIGRTRLPGLALALSATMAPQSLMAQEPGYAVSFRDAPVATALQDLASRSGISLVYDAGVVEGRTTVCRIEATEAEEVLRCILQGAGLDFYQLSSGTYVVIESPEDLPAYGAISGQVVDDLTGEPLTSVRIELRGRPGTAFTNRGGFFTLPRLLPGSYQVQVSRSGYLPQILPFEVGSAGMVRERIRLDPAVLELDPLVVDGISDIGGTLGTEVLEGAGGFGSDLRGARDLAGRARSGLGVSRRPLFADLSIQGSAPGEHLVRLDGVPVFDPVSLGRARSAFSPLALRRINVRKAGFGVEHGSFSGGVIDIEHAVSERTGTGGVTALADPYSMNADVSTGLAMLGGEGTLMLAARTDLWGLYQEPSLRQAMRDWNRVDPVLMETLSPSGFRYDDLALPGAAASTPSVSFNDVHAVLHLDFPGFRTLEGSFYRGTNVAGTESSFSGAWTPAVAGATTGPTQLYVMRDRYSWSNTAGQLRGMWLLGDRASLQARAWGANHELTHEYGMLGTAASTDATENRELVDGLRGALDALPVAEDGNGIRELGAALTGDLAAGGGHFLSGGLEGVSVTTSTFLQNRFLRNARIEGDNWRAAAWIQDRWRIGRRLTVEGGLRVTSVEGGRLWSEPRMSLRMDGGGGWAGPWSAQLSAGVFRQYLNQFSLANLGPSALVPEIQFWMPVDGDLEPARSRHLAAEVALRPWSGWELRGEAYYKAMDRILALDYSVLRAPSTAGMEQMALTDLVGTADGEAYGAGLRLGWESGRARFQAAWDWTVSERTFPSRFQGQRQPTPWVEPHRVVVGTSIPVVGAFTLDIESRNVWGRTWALRRAYYDYLSLDDTLGDVPVGLPGDDPLPNLHHLDVGLSWLGELRGTLAEFRVEVRDAQGTRQILDYSLGQTREASGWGYSRIARRLPGPAFLITARLGFL